MAPLRPAVLGLLLLAGCFRTPPPARPVQVPMAAGPSPVTVSGLENVFRLNARIYSGSGPESETAFAGLRDLGIKTVISVDGTTPDVDAARKYGLRYVHLPVGYDGIPNEQAWRLTKAAVELPGPLYVHCHHGRHRGPAAAAAVMLCFGAWGPDEAEAWLKLAGTDPRYRGLIELPRTLRPPTADEAAQLPPDFPEASETPAMTQAMVEIDERWDRLRKAKAAGWKPPPGEPNLDLPHEAVLLAQHFRELHRSDDARSHNTGFQKMLSELETEACEIERALRAAPPEWPAADKAFQACRATCAKCHARHRD